MNTYTEEDLAKNPNLSVMSEMDETGDTKLIWDRTKPDEVEVARDTFNKLRKKNYLAFKIRGEGEQGEQLHEFDPNVERMILVPQLRGG